MGVRAVTSCQLPVASKRRWGITACLIALLLCACGTKPKEISRIALLAPFEGRYREVGYNAFYAAKLALRDLGNSQIELLAIDDGGTAYSAADRARALAQDPLVKAVVVLGYAATDKETQRAFGDLPVLIAGQWGAKPEIDSVFMLANPTLDTTLTAQPRMDVIKAVAVKTPVVGGEAFALRQFSQLRPDIRGIQIVSSGSLPNAAFRERYLASGQFVPEPNLFATLTYEAIKMILGSLQTYSMDGSSPETANRAALRLILSTGSFEHGYWKNAPVYLYEYDTACVQRGGEMCLVSIDS